MILTFLLFKKKQSVCQLIISSSFDILVRTTSVVCLSSSACRLLSCVIDLRPRRDD